MMNLTFEMRRHLIRQRIPEGRTAEAFGSFCMSRPPPPPTNHLDYYHILCRWLRNPEKREGLLSSCAALLCWDQSSGKLMILSAPRLCLNEKNNAEDDLLIIAQRGNSLKRDAPIVSIPIEALRQSVIGFVPEVVPPALADDIIDDGPNELIGLSKGVEVQAFIGSEAAKMARLPVVLPLPFGHGIDEDLSEDMIRIKLHTNHAYYPLWIKSTGWLCQRLDGKGLQLENQPPPELLHLAPSVHHEGSLPWRGLFHELERIRNENLERFLDRNKEFYEEDSSWKVEGCVDSLFFKSSQNVPGIAMCGHPEGLVPSPKTDANEDLASTRAVSPSESEFEAEGQQSANEREVVRAPSFPPQRRTKPSDDHSPLVSQMQPLQAADSSVCPLQEGDSPESGSGPQDKSEKAELPSPPRLDNNNTSAHVDLSWVVQPAPTWMLEQPLEIVEQHQPVASKRPSPTLLVGEIPVAKKQKSWGKVEDKILKAVAEFLAMNMEHTSRLLVAIFAGYANPDSKGIKDAMKHLKEEGILHLRNGMVVVADVGKPYLPLVDPPKDDAEVHKRILAGIQKKLQAVKKLKALFEELNDGEAHDMVKVARRIGYTNVDSAGFKEARKALDDLGFLIYNRSKKTLQLESFLFPFANRCLSDNTLRDDSRIVSI